MVSIKFSSITVVSLLLLSIFFGMIMYSDNAILHARGAALYVGGTGGGNYSKIQYAIDNASAGDTVYVYDGDYNETIYINKSINLVGNGSASTKIFNETGKSLVEISADNVNISGFTFDGMNTMIAGLFLNNSDNCRIENNILKKCERGIVVKKSDNGIIENNQCNSNTMDGAAFTSADNWSITMNRIEGNQHYGLSMFNASNFTILTNILELNNWSGIGILDLFNDSIIENNTIRDNYGDGVQMNGAGNCDIIYNNLVSNVLLGINITSTQKASMIHHNNFVDNNASGVQASDSDTKNIWDNDQNEGNYWSDYTNRYPAAGFGSLYWDTPYVLVGGGNLIDNYPLVQKVGFSYTPHQVIRIDSDTDFTNASGVVRGDGSEADPYIISGWEINGTGVGNAIFIGNTTKHFVIRNCFTHHSSGKQSIPYYWDSGILFLNVKNGTIDHSESAENYYNILIHSSTNNTVNNSTSYSSTYGLYMHSSDNLTLNKNTLNNNWEALYAEDLSNSLIMNNTGISNNNGFRLQSSVLNNRIIDNDISDSYISMSGSSNNNIVSKNKCDYISISNSDNNTFIDNIIYTDVYGIYLDRATDSYFYSNTFVNSSFYIKGDLVEYYNSHIIPSNNTVKGNPVYYHRNGDWGSSNVPSPAGQVICANITNLMVDSLVINDGSTGIIIAFSSFVDVTDCTVGRNQVGIEIWYSDNITVQGNTVDWNENSGLWQMGNSRDLIIRDNSFDHNSYGIEMQNIAWSLIYNNTCNFNSDTGFYLSESNNNSIGNNNISTNTDYGLVLEDNNIFNLVHDNDCLENQYGIWISADEQYHSVKYNHFNRNNCSKNTIDGIYLDLVSISRTYKNLFGNNTCFNNINNGINMKRSYNNTFIFNFFELNIGNGIAAESSTDNNRIYYNNFLQNGFQANDDGINNSWDDGGEGNYWSDYEDNYVPPASNDGHVWNVSYVIYGTAGEMDNYPLAYMKEFVPPIIVDQSSQSGFTGDGFTFMFIISDNVLTVNATVEYWFGNVTIDTVNITLDLNEPVWMKIIVLPQNSTLPLKYVVSAKDYNGNWRAEPEKSVPITDNDSPTAVAKTDKSFYLEGDTVTFTGSASYDNIGVTNYTWHFIYDTADIYLYGPNVHFTFYLPGIFQVLLNIADAAGSHDSQIIQVNITAIEKPIFTELFYPATMVMDKNIQVSVTILDLNGGGIRSVYFNYTDVNGNNYNTSNAQQVGNIWTFSISGQNSAGTVRFFIWADNQADKINRTATITIQIIDDVLPTIKNVGYPVNERVNVSLLIEAVVVDNDDVSIVRLIYSDVYNVDHNVTMALTSGVLYGYVIPGQAREGTVSFHVWVMDINNNHNRSATYTIDIFIPPVKDLILPYVIKTVPEHNSTDVPINTLVKITFNETMDTSSAIGALSVLPPVNYTVSWSNNDRVLAITFAQNLSYNQTYTITVDIGAKDLADNPLENKFQFFFRTELLPETVNDIDGDGMDDDWERDYGFDPTDPNDAYDDDDSDALINVREYEVGTDPFDADTDNDTLPDGWEVTYELDPLSNDAGNDTDGDGYSNLEEYQGGSKPNDGNSIPVSKKPKDEEGGGLALLAALLVVIIIIVIIFMIIALKRHKVEEEESDRGREEKSEREAEDWEDDTDREVGEDEDPLYADDNYCPECGWELGEDDTVCPDCGAEFAWEDEE